VIQILLWRLGKRKSVDLLSDAEEEELRDTGAEIANEKDIAQIVMTLRSQCERAREAKNSPLVVVGGTMRRPKYARVNA
jgi:hypothetical protein